MKVDASQSEATALDFKNYAFIFLDILYNRFYGPTGTHGIYFIIDSMDPRGLTGFFSTHGDSRDILYNRSYGPTGTHGIFSTHGDSRDIHYNRIYGPTGTHGIFFYPRGLTGYTL